MMHSLEVRSPLLDKKLAEFVSRLPARLKMKGVTRKYILKKAVSGHLPQGIAERAKKGFGVPLGRWFKGPLRDMLHDVFSETSVKQAGYFQYGYVKKLLDEHLSGRHDNRKELWTLLVFELWRRARKI